LTVSRNQFNYLLKDLLLCGLVWDMFGPADNKTWLFKDHPDHGSNRKHSYLEFGNAVMHIDGFANSAKKVIHCFHAHNPIEDAKEGAEVLPDWAHNSGFAVVNCADFPRDFYHQDPFALRNIVRVPGKDIHWLPGNVQFGIMALPFKGHNLPDKGHTTMGRMPFITVQCHRRNMNEEQRSRIHTGP
jgi:hypothetical protein